MCWFCLYLYFIIITEVNIEITKQEVVKFQKLYKEKLNKGLDYKAANHKLSMLVLQMKTVYQPITKKQLDDIVVRYKRKEDAEALARLLYDKYKERNQVN